MPSGLNMHAFSQAFCQESWPMFLYGERGRAWGVHEQAEPCSLFMQNDHYTC